MYYDQPPASVQNIAEIRSSKSRCLITLTQTDKENGDPLVAHCGTKIFHLATSLKGVNVDNINPCHVVIIVNAVREPKVLDVENCSGRFTSRDVALVWLGDILKKNEIAKSQVEYVSYASLAGSLGCYRVAVTFDTRPGANDTSFGERTGTFCVAGADRGRKDGPKGDPYGTKTSS